MRTNIKWFVAFTVLGIFVMARRWVHSTNREIFFNECEYRKGDIQMYYRKLRVETTRRHLKRLEELYQSFERAKGE